MTEIPGRRPVRGADGKSLGELVALATQDLSRLVKSEITLAKMELRDDAKRIGLGAALLGVAAFVSCLVLVLLSIALADGLVALGISPWAAFLIVAGAYVLLSGLLVLVGLLRMRRMTGIRLTRQTVRDDLALLRRSGEPEADGAVEARSASVARGENPTSVV